MTRLTVSILVLAMASWASASYTITATPNDVDFDITVTSNGLDPDEYWVLAITAEGSLYDAAIGPDAPSESFIYPGPIIQEILDYLPGGVDGFYGGFVAAAGEVRKSGTYLTAMASVASVPVVYLYTFDDSMVVSFEDSAEVPEPMTLGLLALGALALLRKRRHVKLSKH